MSQTAEGVLDVAAFAALLGAVVYGLAKPSLRPVTVGAVAAWATWRVQRP